MTMAPQSPTTSPSGGTAVLDRPAEHWDHDSGHLTHIVPVPEDQPDQTPAAYVMRARIEGFEVEALCGYRWVPQRDAKRYPICQKCVEERDNRHGGIGRDPKDLPA